MIEKEYVNLQQQAIFKFGQLKRCKYTIIIELKKTTEK